MSVNEYLMILRKILIKNRAIVRESKRYYKIYLPTEYNEIWSVLSGKKKRIDIIIFLPKSINYVDKILATKRLIIREGDRFKVYLPRRYNDIWEKICQYKKVDLIITFQ